jgi:hypothetical protein
MGKARSYTTVMVCFTSLRGKFESEQLPRVHALFEDNENKSTRSIKTCQVLFYVYKSRPRRLRVSASPIARFFAPAAAHETTGVRTECGRLPPPFAPGLCLACPAEAFFERRRGVLHVRAIGTTSDRQSAQLHDRDGLLYFAAGKFESGRLRCVRGIFEDDEKTFTHIH